ncbi:zf-HC2 domain-containing protein [bacterium BMS3Abin03]|nr:zf-HC2 domain-containing protein [bacterium BMS3Abin03]
MRKNTKEYELLSAYIDDELSPEEKAELEQKILSSLKLRKQLEDLQRIKKLTSSSYKRLQESPYFETRLFAEIDSRSPWYKKILRWSPAISLAVLTISIMMVLNFNPDLIKNLVEEQKSNIAGFYKDNLQPLLFTSDINNEDIFNFAMYKQLPLDKQNSQYLQLGYDPQGKEYVEIRNVEAPKNENNFEKFVMALDLNEIQKKQIDSIIEKYADELGNQVLVNENNTVAINSNLWNYQRAIQSDLFAFAENSNSSEFRKFVPSTVSFVSDPKVVEAVKKCRTTKNKNYIILTPDSIFSEPLEFDFKKFKEGLKEAEAKLNEQNKQLRNIKVKFNYDSTWKDKSGKHYSWHKNFNVYIDTNICRVNIPNIDIPDFNIANFDSLVGIFDSVASNFKFYSKYIPRVEYFDNKMKFHFNNDSTNTIELNDFSIDIDSIMQAQSELMDSLGGQNWRYNYPLNDSLVMRSFPDFKRFFKYFGQESDMKKQMEELKKEIQKFRDEMQDWRKDFKHETKSDPKKIYD